MRRHIARRQKRNSPRQRLNRFRSYSLGRLNDQILIATVQRRFDRLRVLDIDAKQIGDKPLHEWVLHLALFEHLLHRVADALAAGFEIL